MIINVKEPTQDEKEKRIVALEFIPENIEELLSCFEAELRISGEIIPLDSLPNS